MLSLLVMLATLAFAQDSDDNELPAPDPIPELSSREAKKVRSYLRGVQNANAAKLKNARQSLVKIGRGALPLLAEGFLDDTSKEGVKCLQSVMQDLTDDRDQELFESWSREESPHIRWTAATCLGESRHRNASAALKDLVRDKDDTVATRAAGFLARRGEPAGFEVVVRNAARLEGRARESLLEACEGYRETKAPLDGPANRLLQKSEDQQVRIACLQALSRAGATDQIHSAGRCLDHEEHRVKEAAVNALRVLLENKPPKQTITAFDLIEEVDRLKKLLKERSGR